MNIALVDLNLLVVFDAVMREKHVTRAAKRIGMTQPAVSNALNRLRYIAKDDLFVRSSSGVIPTTRALELGPPIRQAIHLVENAFDPSSFDASNKRNTGYFRMENSIPTVAEIGRTHCNIVNTYATQQKQKRTSQKVHCYSRWGTGTNDYEETIIDSPF